MESLSTSVVVKLELGHHASLRSEKTPEGFTHDWTVFVRGPDGTSIQHFVDKVVFFLHEDFPKPKRVIKEPPYQVSESGYAGFMLPIEVYFRNKEEPKKVKFNYDLYLRTFGPPVSNIRCEKLTFQNPTDDFRRKLMKAGGTAYSGGSSEALNTIAQTYNSATTTQEKGEHSTDSQKSASSKSSHRSQDKKKHTTTKDTVKSQSRANHPFTDIFGTPIKRKSSPDEVPAKQKEASAGTHSSHTKPNKAPSSSHSTSTLASTTKESKVGRPPKEKSPHKEGKDAKHSKSLTKHIEKESKQPNVKRQSSPAHAKHASDKKRKRTASASSENNPPTPQAAACAEKKDSSKSKHKEPKVKEKHKSKPVKSDDASIPVTGHKNEKGNTPKPGKKVPAENSGTSPLHHGSQGACSMWADKNSNAHTEERITSPLLETKEDSVMNVDDFNSSPSSSISLSSLPPGGSHGPLATMMAEMEKEPLSPLSSDPGSPSLSNSPMLKDRSEDVAADDNIIAPAVEYTNRTVTEEPEGQPFVKKNVDGKDSNKDKKSDTQRGPKIKKDAKKKRDDTDENKSPHEMTNIDDHLIVNSEDKICPEIDPAYAKELRELQQKIMQSTDRGIIQKIVDVIEETGEFEVTSTAFEFELLKLDQMTVRKLQDCFV